MGNMTTTERCSKCGLVYKTQQPLQGLPNEPTRSALDECAFIHVLPSGSMRCGALRKHHSQYTGHEFTELQPAPSGGEPVEHLSAMEPLESDDSSKCSHSNKEWTLSIVNPADVKCDYDYIALASTHKHALQIVRDHQLAALVPGLVESLREVAIRSLRYCEEKYGHDDQARLNLEATLETVEAIIAIPAKEQKR